jgi:hypothetical protein
MSLINTLDAPSEFDAAAKLRPGEPYFLLIGRDLLAPALVLQWARDNRQRAQDEHDRGLTSAEQMTDELRKSTDAETIAWDMKEYKKGWQARQEAKAGPVATYTGHELPAETQRRDDIQRARTRAAAAMRNAEAELAELEKLLTEPLPDKVPRSLSYHASSAVAYLSSTAELVAPQRRVIDRSRDNDFARDL